MGKILHEMKKIMAKRTVALIILNLRLYEDVDIQSKLKDSIESYIRIMTQKTDHGGSVQYG